MKLVKKFNDFIKNKINEDNSIDDQYRADESDLENSNLIEDIDIDDSSPKEWEEEESGMYKGTQLMKELSEKLGVEIVNNQIYYNGKKINYFSETECFHVDGKKFEDIDKVMDYLQVDNKISESKRYKRHKNRK